MRLVVESDPGVLALNWTWMPTFLGINNQFKNEMEKKLKTAVVGLTLDEKGLEAAHRLVIDYICEKNKGIQGLYDYLDALKYVDVK